MTDDTCGITRSRSQSAHPIGSSRDRPRLTRGTAEGLCRRPRRRGRLMARTKRFVICASRTSTAYSRKLGAPGAAKIKSWSGLPVSANGGKAHRNDQGSCHCGAVRWSFEGVPKSATACNCTVCRRYGVLWAYDYENEGICVSGRTRAYAWGKRTILNFIFARIAVASPIGAPARRARTIAVVSPSTSDSRNLISWAPSSWITSTG